MNIKIEELPDGYAKGDDGTLFRRFKQCGPNYSHRTPVTHDDRMRIGCKYDLYPIDPKNPDKPLIGYIPVKI